MNSTEDYGNDTCDNLDTGYYIASFYLLASLPGILVYSFTVFIIIYKFKELHSPFYILAIALAVSDILPLCITAFYSVPCIILCRHILQFISPYIFGWITHICWYLQITFIFVISINRFVCMNGKGFKSYDWLFTYKKMMMYIFVSVLFSLSMILMMNLCSIFSILNYKQYYFGFDLNTSLDSAKKAIYANAVINDVVIAATALMYFASWAFLKVKRATVPATVYSEKMTNNVVNKARKKAETRLFLQFIIVSSILVLYQISFYILPLFLSGTMITLITGAIYIALCSMNGYLHMCLNSVIQTEAKCFLKIKSK